MTKNEFVDLVVEKSGLSRRDAERAVDAFLESVTDALESGDDLSFTGVGRLTGATNSTAESLRAEANELERERDRLHSQIEAERATLREIAAG